VISCHLCDIGEYLVMVDYICYRGNNHVLINERRPGGIEIEKRQGMEVLGAYLYPSVSFKNRFTVRPHVMLNTCLTLSWPDTLQGSSANATPHDCNTTNLVAIRGSYCNLSVKWLQYRPIMQRTKCVAICMVSRCNRRVLLQPFKNCVTISWRYCHGALELH
jgi:hypothetical protein